MQFWQHIESEISRHTGRAFSASQQLTLGGGCINQASRISAAGRDYFIKLNRAECLPMFEAEAQALGEIAASQSLRVPAVICSGRSGEHSYLVLEYLELGGGADMALFGTRLAAMHSCQVAQYGWSMDNTIGSSAQCNRQQSDWIEFWREQRLGFQLALAARKGYGGALQAKGERLLADFPALFTSYTPAASLLHGDLWSGNYAGLADTTPVIYDPALYYGDRECDIAMTTLFGGFGADFYAAYNAAWPLDPGYGVRKTFYNIYHVINHLNLFGGGYQSQAIGMIDQVLAEL